MEIKTGDIVEIKPGWDDPSRILTEIGKYVSRIGIVIGDKILLKQWWTPILWEGDEDPDWHKSVALRPWACRTLKERRRIIKISEKLQ